MGIGTARKQLAANDSRSSGRAMHGRTTIAFTERVNTAQMVTSLQGSHD